MVTAMNGQMIVTIGRDGVIKHKCVACGYMADVKVPADRRTLVGKCICGLKITYTIERRKSRRQPYQFGDAQCTLSTQSKCMIQPKDISFGGMSFKMLRAEGCFVVGKKISITYELSRGVKRTHDFFVRSVDGEHVGVQYADGKDYSPQQRMIMQ